MHRIRKHTTPKGDGNSRINICLWKTVLPYKKTYNSERRRKRYLTEDEHRDLLNLIRKHTTPKGDGNLGKPCLLSFLQRL